MTRLVTDHEMNRRRAMAKAQESLINAMAEHRLTPLEWCRVLNNAFQRVIVEGLEHELKDGTE